MAMSHKTGKLIDMGGQSETVDDEGKIKAAAYNGAKAPAHLSRWHADSLVVALSKWRDVWTSMARDVPLTSQPAVMISPPVTCHLLIERRYIGRMDMFSSSSQAQERYSGKVV